MHQSAWIACRIFAIAAVAFSTLLFLPPSAHADIIEIENSTGCASQGSLGGGLCNGTGSGPFSPFNLTSLLNGLSVGNPSAQKYVVTDTTGSFTFTYTGSPGDNGSCQINGSQSADFNACKGTNSDGTGFSLGHDDTTHPGMNPPTIVTFTALAGHCTAASPCTFDIGFISWQGTGTITPSAVPEPSSVLLAATALGILGSAIVWRRRNSGRGACA